MPVDPSSAARTSTANAIRLQKLITEVRAQGMLPNEEPQASHGREQAQRAAAAIGVGDNLRASLQDLFTQDMPMAQAWPDRMSQDIVTGDGDIEPAHTTVKVELRTAGKFEAAGGAINDASTLASLTGELIADSGAAAVAAHRGAAASLIFGG